MLQELVDDFVENKNIIITSSAGNGTTSLCLFLINLISRKDKIIIYFNPLGNIDKIFVKKYYPLVYENVLFVTSTVPDLLVLLQYLSYKIDYLVVDPGDCLLYNPQLIPMLSKMISGNIFCTSQIRHDLSKGGKIYSTVERKFLPSVFKYSLWIRNVTEYSFGFKRKYIDVFDKQRSGNNNIARYIGNFTKEGNIVN